MKSFEDLAVWQEGCKIAKEIYQVTGEGDFTKDFGLKDQIRRIVIASEVARQSRSKPERARFLSAFGGFGTSSAISPFLQRLPRSKRPRNDRHNRYLQSLSLDLGIY